MASETIERVAAAEVDVLLLDVRMPKKSGLDVLRELGDRCAAADAGADHVRRHRRSCSTPSAPARADSC